MLATATPRRALRTLLATVPLFGSIALGAAPVAVATFESIGVAWSPESGSSSVEATVRYRVKGSSAWKTGHPLWFDPATAEYRGSLVQLKAGTTYEIELKLDDGYPVTLSASTWSETFPIAKTIVVPAASSDTLVVKQGGSAAGYVLYTHAPGKPAVIDVKKAKAYNVDIRASYVIVRGLTLRGAQEDGIRFSQSVNHAVIQDNEITDWGSQEPGSIFGGDTQSGIRAKNVDLKQVVIERNYIHHPTYDAKSWCEDPLGNPLAACDLHTAGPGGIRLSNAAQNIVIRYNTVTSDANHYFEDCLGGEGTSAAKCWGFPGSDSDVYGNQVERCWDNGIEAETCTNRNARIWGNFFDYTYRHIAIAPAGDGPMYIWRNVVNAGRKGPFSDSSNEASSFIKFGRDSVGRVYVYNNTMLQPTSNGVHGATEGIGNGASGTDGSNLIARNNILHVQKSSNSSAKGGGSGNTCNWDLYNGGVPSGQEANGVKGTPLYTSANPPMQFFLSKSSLGYDDGMLIPNFADDFAGAAPDLGAFENGKAPLEFGVNAYKGGGSDSGGVPDDGVYELESSFGLSGFQKELDPLGVGFAGVRIPGGGGDGDTGVAEATFSGPDGVYDVEVVYLTENDGQPQLKLSVGGVSVASFTYELATLPFELRSRTFPSVSVKHGDGIKVKGVRFGNAFARIDRVVFHAKSLPDGDGDGVTAPLDCDDTDASTHPGTPEKCGDSADNDCDGVVDEGCNPALVTVTLELESNFGLYGLDKELESLGVGFAGVRVPAGGGDGDKGTAKAFFYGKDGVYDVEVVYVTENDGQPELSIDVAGVLVGSFTYELSNLPFEMRSRTYSDVSLHQGDVVGIEAVRFGAAYARVDRVVLYPAK